MRGKSKKTLHRLCAYLLMLALILSLMSTSALAVDAKQVTSTTDNLTYDQTTTVTWNESGYSPVFGTTMTIESYIQNMSEQTTIKATDLIFVLDQSDFINGSNGEGREDVLAGVKDIVENLPEPTNGDTNKVAIVGYGRINQWDDPAYNTDSGKENDGNHPGVAMGSHNYSYNTGFYISPDHDSSIQAVNSSLQFYAPLNSYTSGSQNLGLIEASDKYVMADSDYDGLITISDNVKQYMTYQNAFMTTEQALDNFLNDPDTKMAKFTASASRLDVGLVLAQQLMDVAAVNAESTQKDRNTIICVVSGTNVMLQNGAATTVIRSNAAIKAADQLKNAGATIFTLGNYHSMNYNITNTKNKIADNEDNFNEMMTAVAGSVKTTTTNEEAQYYFSSTERGSLSKAIEEMSKKVDEVAEAESQEVTIDVTIDATNTVYKKDGTEKETEKWQKWLQEIANDGGSAVIDWADCESYDADGTIIWGSSYGYDTFSVKDALTVNEDNSITMTFPSSLVPIAKTTGEASASKANTDDTGIQALLMGDDTTTVATATKVRAVISGVVKVTYKWVGDAPSDAILPDPVTVDSNGFTVADAPTTSVSGYTFLGWYHENDKDTDDVTKAIDANDIMLPSENETLYGKWSYSPMVNYFTATTHTDTETASKSSNATTVAGTDGLIPADGGYTPTNGTYGFGGWYLDKELTQPYEGDVVAANMTGDLNLYAKWYGKFRVEFWRVGDSSQTDGNSFSGNCAAVGADGYVDITSSVFDQLSGNSNSLKAAVANKYAAEGITKFALDHAEYKYNGSTDYSTTALPVTADGTLCIRIYYNAQVTVTYDLNYDDAENGDTYASADVAKGGKHTVAADPTRDGYVFTGWTIKDGNGTVYKAGYEITIDNDITLVAQWTAAYIVSYDLNYDDADKDETYKNVSVLDGGSHTVAADPTREGYNFTEWKIQGDTTDKVYQANDTITVNSNITLVAQWEAKPATVKFEVADNNGSVTGAGATQNFNAGVVSPSLDAVTVEGNTGYVFDYWTKDDDTEAVNPMANIVLENGQEVVFKAHFAADTNGNGVPDKHDATVTYKIVGDTWNDNSTENKTEIIQLMKFNTNTQEWATLPATLQNIPTPTVLDGTWTKTVKNDQGKDVTTEDAPNSTSEVTDDVTYTYTVVPHTITVKVINGTATLPDNTTITGNENGETGAATIKHKEDVSLKFAAADGYALDSVVVTKDSDNSSVNNSTQNENLKKSGEYRFEGVDDDYTIIVTYADDKKGKPILSEDDPETGDGIPDKYQVTVAYKVEGGTWDGEDPGTKYETVNNYVWSNDEGKYLATDATLNEVPVTDYAIPDENHTVGAGWQESTPVNGETKVTEDTTFTYTFLAKIEYKITVVVNNGTAADGEIPVDSGSVLTVDNGGDKTLTFTASEGYALDSVMVTKGEGEDANNFEQNENLYTNGEYTFTNVTENYTITVTYETDANNDGIPDKYQVTVTYKVEGGTWDGTDTADKSEVVTIAEWSNKAGEYEDTNATLKNVPATGEAQPDENHTSDASWKNSTPVNGKTTVAEDTTFTYTFMEEGQHTITVIVNNGTAADGEIPVASDSVLIVDNGGKKTLTFTANDGYALDSVVVTKGEGEDANNSEQNKNLADNSKYEFSNVTENYTIIVTYETDTNGNGVPDKYQVTVTYKVEGGTWDGTDTADKSEVVTLSAWSDEAGKYEKTGDKLAKVPNVENAKPDATHIAEGAEWKNSTPKNGDAVTQNTTFTYTFPAKAEEVTYTITVIVNNGTAKDGETPVASGNTVTVADGGEKTLTFTANDGYALDSVVVTKGEGENANNPEQNENLYTDGEYTFTDVKANYTITVTYETDANNDGIPDKYQVTVTYKVEGGTWEDGTTESGELVTISKWNRDEGKYVTTEAQLKNIPDVDKAVPDNTNTDTGASWGDSEPTTSTVVTGETTYTYTFPTISNESSDEKPQTYTVTYDLNGGTDPGDDTYKQVTVNSGDDHDVAADPTKEGYIFIGWQMLTGDAQGTAEDENLLIFGDTIENVTENITLVAQWRSNAVTTYTVTYDLNNGTDPGNGTYDPAIVNSGDDHKVKTNPDREGYTFDGWKSDGDESGTLYKSGDTIENVTANITLVAQWTIIPVDVPTSGAPSTVTYTLTYVANGGTEYAKESYASGTQVDLTKSPIRTGYTFTGWYTDEGLTEIVTSVKMTGNITVYAGWKVTTVPSLLDGDDHIAYIIGYDDGDVKPTGNITRAEVATIFFRLLTAEARDGNLTTENNFSDVNAGSWYNQPVSTMAALGLITGRSDGTFDPNAPITRAEFAAICARFETNVSGYGSDFSDISGHWAESAIQEAARLGWISGYPDGTFRPNQNITRGEAASIINRVLCRIPADESDLLEDMNVWPDNTDTSKFYYLAIQEATNTHESVSKGEINETWTQLTADPDWKRYEK